ncbi:MAG: hypothetical protein J5544_05505 [Clostridia bacterium]|nr:hypothetical protein [Clostridia bacterium]
MLKKILSLILAVMIVAVSAGAAAEKESCYLLPTGTASADPYKSDSFTFECDADDPESRADYMNVNKFYIESTSVGKIKVVLKVTTQETMLELGFSRLVIQYWNGSSWAKYWDITDQYSYGTTLFNYNHTDYSATSGEYYRVKAYLVAQKTSISVELKTVTSSYITCM